jgi:acetyl esterase/lipase
VIPEHDEQEERLVAALAASSRSTIARVNYRFSPDNTWPTPLHDVLAGYDWVFQNLLEDEKKLVKLGVCGELIGGSLATALALTECHLGQSRIVAAAVNNPIADWVFPDDIPAASHAELPEPRAPEEIAVPADQDMMTPAQWAQQEEEEGADSPTQGKKRKKRASKTSTESAWVSNRDNPIIPTGILSEKRDVLFSNPQHFLDRFASPIHFFRSPHGQLVYPQDDDIFASLSSAEIPQDPIDRETQLDLDHYDSLEAQDDSPDVPILTRCRAYARVYPPAGSSLSLPQWYITSGAQSPLLDQSSELTRMLRRSVARQELRAKAARVMWHDRDEKAKYEAWAELRVYLRKGKGTGLWSIPDSNPTESTVEEAGRWMNSLLQP